VPHTHHGAERVGPATEVRDLTKEFHGMPFLAAKENFSSVAVAKDLE